MKFSSQGMLTAKREPMKNMRISLTDPSRRDTKLTLCHFSVVFYFSV
jgi:hypothetical protein